MDRTKYLETWNEGIKYQKLSFIADVCNHFILRNVFCTLGWSGFIHKVGYVDLDTFVQQFIQNCNLSIIDVSKLSKSGHTRDDYIQYYTNEYDMWIHNSYRILLPIIYFVDEYPWVLSRKDHYGGCNFIHIICCIWSTDIPSPVSDQVCHAVVRPWTLKHMKDWVPKERRRTVNPLRGKTEFLANKTIK